MGMTGALKLRTIVENAENVLAIELLAAAEGIELRRPLKAGVGVERAFDVLARNRPASDEDRAVVDRHRARCEGDSRRKI